MPLTDPNMAYHTPASNVAMLVDLVEGLCGGVGTLSSTVTWLVVESWDGTTREVPTGGLLSNSTNAWAPGGGLPGSGSWIVLQSLPGANAAYFQVRFIVNGSTPQFQLIPFADWPVGGGTGGTPSLPSRLGTTHSFNVTTGTAPRCVVWDESMFAIMTLNTADATASHAYCGELDYGLGETADPRPFVSTQSSTNWAAHTGWFRTSPVNQTTSLTAGAALDGTINDATAWPMGACIAPLAIFFNASSHQHFAGYARHIGSGPQITTNTRYTFGPSLGVRDWAGFRGTGQSNSSLMRHDGTTLTTDELRALTFDEALPSDGYSLVRTYPRLIRIR